MPAHRSDIEEGTERPTKTIAAEHVLRTCRLRLIDHSSLMLLMVRMVLVCSSFRSRSLNVNLRV